MANFFKTTVLSVALTLAAGAALAGVQPAASPALPGALVIAQTSGMKVVKTFSVSKLITGYVVSQAGQLSILYGTPDGYMLAGALLASDGTNLTAVHSEKYAQAPVGNIPQAGLDKLSVLHEGKGKDGIYVFFDTECSFCRVLHKALDPYAKAGVAINWVPVAMLSPNSMTNGARVLATKNAAAVGPALNGEYKATRPDRDVDPDLVEDVKNNSLALSNLGIGVTPAIVYKLNGKYVVKKGMPRLSDLPEITGKPLIPTTDPELARFR